MKFAFEELVWLFTSNEHSRGIVRLNLAEGALLYKYCRKKKDGVLLEIGRKHGGSTAIMASALDSGIVHSIDIVMHQKEVDDNLMFVKDRVRLITCDSKQIAWDRKLDLLFIDGDHSYQGVKNDVRRFAPFVVVGGYIIMHDVVGKKLELQPIVNKLIKREFVTRDVADSMMVLERVEKA